MHIFFLFVWHDCHQFIFIFLFFRSVHQNIVIVVAFLFAQIVLCQVFPFFWFDNHKFSARVMHIISFGERCTYPMTFYLWRQKKSTEFRKYICIAFCDVIMMWKDLLTLFDATNAMQSNDSFFFIFFALLIFDFSAVFISN